MANSYSIDYETLSSLRPIKDIEAGIQNKCLLSVSIGGDGSIKQLII